MSKLDKMLASFQKEKHMTGKGSLCVALVVTRRAKKEGLPLDPDALLTKAGGQVAGLGKGAVQAILSDHGINQVLAEEGGRTSRGSVGKMRAYVAFLNELASKGLADLDAIEEWWCDRVRTFIAGKPLVLHFDTSKSLRSIIHDLLEQAEKHQGESSGTMYVGAVIQQLVGAKLDIMLGGISHHGASVADEGSGRDADYVMGDVAIHVTTAPNEALIRKCGRNLANGLRPVIVTVDRGIAVAHGLAHQFGIADRIDVLDVEQFLASNVYEHGRFELSGRRDSIERLVEKYNEIIEECETDPSLRIDFAR